MEINALEIKKFRKKYRLTQYQLADLLGVSYRTVQNYERGGIIPKSKLRLFITVFESYEDSKVVGMKGLTEKYKSAFAIEPKFANLSIDEIARYVVIYDEELMKNKIFQTYIKNKQSEKAIEMLLKEIEKMEKGKYFSVKSIGREN